LTSLSVGWNAYHETSKNILGLFPGMRGGGFTYGARIQYRDFKCYSTFQTEDEAKQFIHDVSVREGLPIRNRFTMFENKVEVELPGGNILICDVEDLHFVEQQNWCCSNYGYAVTTIDGGKLSFHNMVPGKITVDHHNLNRLDSSK